MAIIPATAEIWFDDDSKQELMLYFKSGHGFFWSGLEEDDPWHERVYTDERQTPHLACHWLDLMIDRIGRGHWSVDIKAPLLDGRYTGAYNVDTGDFRLFNYLSGGEVNRG